MEFILSLVFHNDNLFLVGLMGAGKTTIGRALAKKLSLKFIDADHELEARLGVSIAIIFEHEGEIGFRRREAELIQELTAEQKIILATGGGAILNENNRNCLNANGTVIYLHATVNDLWLRTRYAKHRPLLQCSEPRKILEKLYKIRDPLYRQCAHLIVNTGKPSVTKLTDKILCDVQNYKISQINHQ